MSEESIGAARIDLIVNADQFKVEVERAKTLTSQLGDAGEASYQKLDRGAKAATRSLLKFSEGFGKTTEEQKLLNAAMRGVPIEILEQVRQKILAQRDAMEATKRAAQQQAEAVKAAAQLQSASLGDSQLFKANQAIAAFRAKTEAAIQAAKASGPSLDSSRLNDSQFLRANQSLTAYKANAEAAAKAAQVLQQAEAAEAKQAAVSNGIRERLAAFLATERGERVLAAEAARKEGAALASGASAFRNYGSEAASAVKGAGAAMKSASHSAHEFGLNNSFARRELGRLANDLVNGNYGRFQQTSLTLANATGLLGKAFTTTGLAIGGVAAIVGSLTLAYYKGQLEAEAYNKALIVTGNYAGVTAFQLGNLAKEISKTIGTQHEAAAALAAVASSGKFTASQLQLVARAAVDANRIMGQSTEATIQQFEKLKDDPVKAVQALNDAQHFLTLATYERIKALQDEGKNQEAATLAIKNYSDTLDERRQDVIANLGLFERGWLAVKNATKAAADAALDIGRYDIGKEIEGKQRELQALLKGGGTSANFVAGLAPTVAAPVGDSDPRVQALRKEISDLYTKAENEAKAARDRAMQAQITQDKADSDREVAEFATNAQKRATELAKVQGEYNARIARALAAGNKKLADDLRASEKLVLAGIQEKYKDPKTPKSPEVSAYATFKAQVDALQVKNVVGDNSALTQYEQGIRKLADEMAVYLSKTGNATKAAAEFNRGQQALAETLARAKKQEVDAENAYAFALDKSTEALARQVNDQVMRIGMGQKEYERTQQINQAYREQADALGELALKRQMGANGESGGISQEQYDADVAKLKETTDRKVRIMQDGFRRTDAAQAKWVNGFTQAYTDFVDQAANVADQTNQLFSNAFNSMADALATFATTGKLDFKSLADGIIADLARMEARILVSRLLQGVLGGSFGGGGEMATSFDSNGTFFSPYAKGGVFAGSPSLSAYSGQIVDKPTLFAFARGAGIMGEAGPEAIVPLKRGPNGRLGIEASGGAGRPVVIHQTIHVNGRVDRQTTQQIAQQAAQRQRIATARNGR